MKQILIMAILLIGFGSAIGQGNKFDATYLSCSYSDDAKDWEKEKNVTRDVLYIVVKSGGLTMGLDSATGVYRYSSNYNEAINTYESGLPNLQLHRAYIDNRSYIDRKTLDIKKPYKNDEISGQCEILTYDEYTKKRDQKYAKMTEGNLF